MRDLLDTSDLLGYYSLARTEPDSGTGSTVPSIVFDQRQLP